MLFPQTPLDQYRGRFAPSPSGDLHFGSLIAALASFLDARHHQGKWLLRIDDIDPPREVAGAADNIQRTLENHGLFWDEEVCFQSQQSERYEQALEYLHHQQLSYYCECTRKQIQADGGQYRQTCRNKHLPSQGCSLRLINHHPITSFHDHRLHQVQVPHAMACEDFIIKRRDGYYAYHLAAVVDDIHQRITHIVRGEDLKDPTACQLALYQVFSHPTPAYLHLPVAVTSSGLKLSKQNHAPALAPELALQNLYQALQFLQQPLLTLSDYENCESLLIWAIEHWQTTLLPGSAEIRV